MLHLLRLAALAAALMCASGTPAQTYPSKPIKWIVPYTPAGITDNVTRVVTQKVQEQTGWNIVVENKPGANSILGADLAAKSAPDGYTFLTVIAAHAANATLYAGKLPYDPVKSFAPVSLAAIAPLIMTAFGLAVAIPAVLAYNVFGRVVGRIEAELEGFAHDLLGMLGDPPQPAV